VRIPVFLDMTLCDLLIPEDEDTTFLRYVWKHSPHRCNMMSQKAWTL